MTQEEKKRLVIKTAKAIEQKNTAIATAESVCVKLLKSGKVDSYDMVKICERVAKYIIRSAEAYDEMYKYMSVDEAKKFIDSIGADEVKSDNRELRDLALFIIGDKLEDYMNE